MSATLFTPRKTQTFCHSCTYLSGKMLNKVYLMLYLSFLISQTILNDEKMKLERTCCLELADGKVASYGATDQSFLTARDLLIFSRILPTIPRGLFRQDTTGNYRSLLKYTLYQ